MEHDFKVIEPAVPVDISQDCLALVSSLIGKGSKAYLYKPARWLGVKTDVAAEFAGEENACKQVPIDYPLLENGHVCALGSWSRWRTTLRQPLMGAQATTDDLVTIGPVTDDELHAKRSGTTLTIQHFHLGDATQTEGGTCEIYPSLAYQLDRSKTPKGKSALSLIDKADKEIVLLRVPGKNRRGDPVDIWTAVNSKEDLEMALNTNPDPSNKTGWGWAGVTSPTIKAADLPGQGRFHVPHVHDGIPVPVTLQSAQKTLELSATLIRPGWTLRLKLTRTLPLLNGPT